VITTAAAAAAAAARALLGLQRHVCNDKCSAFSAYCSPLLSHAATMSPARRHTPAATLTCTNPAACAVVRAFLVFATGVIISRNFGEALFVS
jgi:hypothetical protein